MLYNNFLVLISKSKKKILKATTQITKQVNVGVA